MRFAMKGLAGWLAGMAVLLSATSLAAAQAVAASPQAVKVVNPASSPVPVSGSVSVTDLPLDASGNLRTSTAPDTTVYTYVTLTAYPCYTGVAAGVPGDFCDNSNYKRMAESLATLSSEGYSVISILPVAGPDTPYLVYTLKAPASSKTKPAAP